MQHWRHFPWLLAILLAPILHGSVDPEGQSVIGLLLATSLLLLAGRFGSKASEQRLWNPAWSWIALACLLVSLVPLPIEIMEWLNPQRAALAQEFALEQGLLPAWIPATLSTSLTVQRLSELALILTAFCLARFAAAQPGFSRHLVTTLALALLFLALSDIAFRLTGQQRLLGIWPDTASHGAGTFANRNHFANWIYVAALFASGYLLRYHCPLRSTRSQDPPPTSTPSLKRPPLHVLLLWIAIPFSLIMAVQSGSRAGLVAFLAGCAVWALFLVHRSHSRLRWIGLAGTSLALTICLLASADYLWNRIATVGSDLSFKTSIWTDSLALIERFPLLGTGSGAFVTAFNHFKSFGGEQTFLHTENEFIQLLVEHGLVGGFLLTALLLLSITAAWRFAWRQSLHEPELVFGALAALAAFLTHCLVEFVFQIPATALLAAVLLGFTIGHRDTLKKPAVAPPPTHPRILLNLGWSTALLLLAAAQGTAALRWHQARAASALPNSVRLMEQSLHLWPWNSQRQLALTRLQVQALPNPQPPTDPDTISITFPIRQQLNQTLARDPFNWELRLERAWLDIAFSPNQPQTLHQVWETIRLNPLQPQIPLQFARHFAPRHPQLALELLQTAHFSRQDHLRQAFDLAWTINQKTESLWALTPVTPPALETLANFASEIHLDRMATQARNLALNHPLPPPRRP